VARLLLRDAHALPSRMSYLALARKWRPRRFDELVGQEHVVRALTHALDGRRLHPALLFSGTRGVGKTTIARIVAKSLNCEQGVSAVPCGECAGCREIDEGRFVDLIEVDAASRTRVDDTRELLDNVQYAPARGRTKVYLIDEVHMLSTHSFNALLKTLEEPPPHIQFLLATTDPQKLPVTILSRCLQFHLKRLPAARIARYLEHVLAQEGVEAEPGALQRLARAADGSMRDALSLLDQAIPFGGGRLSDTDVADMLGHIDRGEVLALAQALADGDGRSLIDAVSRLDEIGAEPAAVLDELAATLQRIALLQVVPDAAGGGDAPEWHEALSGLAGRVMAEDVQLWYQTAILGRRDLAWAPDPRIGLEMTLLRMLAFRPDEAGGAQADAAREAPGSPRPASTQPPAAAKRPAPGQPPTQVAPARSKPVAQREDVGEAGAPGAASADTAEVSWESLVPRLGLRGAADQLARHCACTQRSGSSWTLTLAPQVQQLLTDGARARLEKALKALLGEDVRVRIEVGEGGGATPAQRAAERDEARAQAARKAIEDDPNVQAARERLGASVRPGSIRPLDE